MEKKEITVTVPQLNLGKVWRFARQWLLPNPGTILLLIIMMLAVPALARQDGVSSVSTSTIPYQGRLADAGGNPITGQQNMEFRIYDVPTGGTPLWEEFWTGGNSVSMSDGLFSVMLGSINTDLTSVVQGYSNLYLGITVGTDSEMEPRVQLGSVPFSMWSLTVADNSITSAKIAEDAVGSSEIEAGAVGNSEIATDAVGSDEIANASVISEKIVDRTITNEKFALSYWFTTPAGDVDISGSSPTEVDRLDVDFPVDGVYLLIAKVISSSDAADDCLSAEIWDETGMVNAARILNTHPKSGNSGRQSGTIVTIEPFSAGPHTFRLMAYMSTGTGGTVKNATEFMVIPFGQP